MSLFTWMTPFNKSLKKYRLVITSLNLFFLQTKMDVEQRSATPMPIAKRSTALTNAPVKKDILETDFAAKVLFMI